MTTQTLPTDPRSLARPAFQRAWEKRQALLPSPLLPSPGLPIGILARLSTSTEANQDNEQTQLADCHGWLPTYGLEPGPVFVMRGQPAFDQVEPWEGYVQAWNWVAEGQVCGLAAQALDRILRDVGEAVRLFDHCLAHDVRRVIVGGQQYDLKDPNHYKLLCDMASEGQRESAVKRVRSLNKGTQKAKSGSAAQGGYRAFGFKKGGLKLKQSEADEVKAMVEGFLSDKPLLTIAKDLNDRGITTTTGGKWTHTTVKQVITSWRICGWRSHLDAPVAEGDWPAIVSREQVEAVRAVIASRMRPAAGQKQLLTGLMVCGCGCGYVHRGQSQRPMKNGKREAVPGYVAASTDKAIRTKEHCSVVAAHVEGEVVQQFFHRVNRGGWRKLATQDNSQARNDLQAQQAQLTASLATLALQLADPQNPMTAEAYGLAAQAIAAQQEALKLQLATLAVPQVQGTELEHIQSRWEGLSVPEQRKYLGAMVEAVELQPGIPGQPWDGNRVKVVWKV